MIQVIWRCEVMRWVYMARCPVMVNKGCLRSGHARGRQLYLLFRLAIVQHKVRKVHKVLF